MATQITVIGGGLTGSAAAMQLLCSIDRPFDLAIVDPDEHLGCGLAYGRAAPFHLLNVRAGKLGVINGQPNDFAMWARETLFGIRPRPGQSEPARAFLPRRSFGIYVGQRLRRAISRRSDVRVTHLRSTAKCVRRSADGFEILLDTGAALPAHFVILATGYGRAAASGRFGRLPFADLDPAEARAARSALFIGTGLSFVDEFLRLRSLGFRGKAIAISRRGLMPKTHRPNEDAFSPDCLRTADLRALTRAFIAEVRRADEPAARVVDLIVGLRANIQTIWQSLDTGEQRRFLRHLRPHWNVVRHRLAPEISAQLRQAMQGGSLTVVAGRPVATDHGFRVHAKGRDRDSFDLTFDCTGFQPDVASPLMCSLIGQGLAAADPHGLGLAVAQDGSVKSSGDAPRGRLFALGPLGHGSLYEITAVPEIVAQSAAMAKVVSGVLPQLRATQFLHDRLSRRRTA